MNKEHSWNKSNGIILTRNHLALVKNQIAAKNPEILSVWKQIKNKADNALTQELLSVTQKTTLPPSGDLHDYMSVGTYWWPNPDTPDGLPYIRRDGEINPVFKGSDVDRIKTLTDKVQDLSIAAFFSDNITYAQKAAELVRHWFIEPETRMNPHLRYAQHIPGKNDGRSLGIIDFKSVRQMLDAVCLLPIGAWSPEDENRLTKWMFEYLGWLLNDDFGKRESAQKNNHGTWFDAQSMAVALYVGDIATAKVIAERGKQRIADQITPDGLQPLELSRSRPITYCMMNLQGLFDIASMAEKIGVDLFGFKTGDGKSLECAIKWILPYAYGQKKYKKKDIKKPSPMAYISLFRRAANMFRNMNIDPINVMSLGCSATDALIYPEFKYIEDKKKWCDTDFDHRLNASEIRSNVYVVPYDEPWVGGPCISLIPDFGRITRCKKAQVIYEDEFKESHYQKRSAARKVKGRFLYGGPFYAHFGHIMTDSIIRLYAFDANYHAGVILVNCKNNKDGFREILNQVLDFLLMPNEKVVMVSEPVVFEEVHFVEPGSILGGGPSQWYLRFLADLNSKHELVSSTQSLPKKIYLGRNHIIKSGTLMGELYFLNLLLKNGFEYIKPEKLTFMEQLRLLKSANQIVFLEGSSIYSVEVLGSLKGNIYMIPRRNSFYFFENHLKDKSQFYVLGRESKFTKLLNNREKISSHSPSYVTNPETIFNDMLKQGLIAKEVFSKTDFLEAQHQDLNSYYSGHSFLLEKGLKEITENQRFSN